jgi:hypothetical protein
MHSLDQGNANAKWHTESAMQICIKNLIMHLLILGSTETNKVLVLESVLLPLFPSSIRSVNAESDM